MRKIRSIEKIEEDKLEAKLEDSIFLRAIDFGLEHPDGFTCRQIITELKLNEETSRWERDIIEKYLHSAYVNARETKTRGRSGNAETPFLLVGQPSASSYEAEQNKYVTSLDAHFKYIDYQELKLARKTASEAKRLSMWAIRISILAIIISALVPLWIAYNTIQTVRIDEGQLQIFGDEQIP